MNKRLRTILILLQVISFIPFFFGSFVFVMQIITDFGVISHFNQYESGIFIVKEKTDEGGGMVGWSVSYDSIVSGNVNNIASRIMLAHIKEWGNPVNVDDTVYVWYRDDGRFTLVRKKEDTTFHITQYIQTDFRGLMLFGIPPFIIIACVRRRMKKKDAKQNNTI